MCVFVTHVIYLQCMLGPPAKTGRHVDKRHVELSYHDSILLILHGGNGALTLTMPDPDSVQQQGLPSGPEQTLPQQLSQLPLLTRFDRANGPNQAECWIWWS